MKKRVQIALLLAGLLVAFALRMYRLGDQNIWWDEGFSVWAVRGSLIRATLITARDVHPPLYLWFLWPWLRLVGDTEFAGRALSVLAALPTVAAMAPLGRRVGGRWVGIGGLWLLALSRFHIWWSQEMRMYALAALWATLSFYFLARAASARSRRPWFAWIGATAAALYTLYFSALLLACQNLFALIVGLRRSDRWAFWRRWCLAQGAALALWVPWLAFAIPRIRSGSVVEEPALLGFVFQLNGVLLGLGISTYIERYRGAALALGFVLLWGVVTLVRRRSPTGRLSLSDGLALLLTGVLVPPTMVWLVTQPRALFYTPRVEARYFLSFAPLFYVLLAWALVGLVRARLLRPVGLVASVGVLAMLLWALPGHYADRYLRDDLRTMTRAIWSQARPEDGVVLVSGDRAPLFLYYYDHSTAPPDRPSLYPVPRLAPVLDGQGVEAELAPIAREHPRVWLAEVEAHMQDPQRVARAWLAERYPTLLSLGFGYNRLSLFDTGGTDGEVVATTPPQHPLDVPLGPVTVVGYDLAVREVRPLDPLRLGLHLRVREPVTLTVALVGLDGLEVARTSLPVRPVGGTVWRMAELPVIGCAPPGPYRFELRTPEGASVSLGGVRITHAQPPPAESEIQHPMEARVGEVRFLGYDLYRDRGLFRQRLSPGQIVRPGDRLVLRLYWRADGPVDGSYTVFTHLVGAAFNPATGGPVWAQEDRVPLEGTCPTDLWPPDLLLRDEYELLLPSDAPPGEYLLEIGMYRPGTGERLPVAGDGADVEARRLVIATVPVE